MASSIWHTEGEFWVPKYQIYFGGVMNTPAYVVFGKKKKKGLIVSSRKAQERKKKNYVIVKKKNHVDTLMDPT